MAAKNVLYVCNTYYQLIVASQIALTIHSNEHNHLMLTDHSQGAREIAARCSKESLYDSVHFKETKHLYSPKSSLWSKTRMFLNENFGSIDSISDIKFDEVFFYNYHAQIYGIADGLWKNKRQAEFHRFEESMTSCSVNHSHAPAGRMKLAEKVRLVTGRPRVSQLISDFYCFLPELCDEPFPLDLKKIPSLEQTKQVLVPFLKRVFQFDVFPYRQKYIFLASSSDIDDKGFGETRLILDLAERIGAENLLVKMHPRDDRKVYEKAGIQVMRDFQAPWEIVQLSENLSDRTLLTATSSSILTMSALMKRQPQSYYVIPTQMSRREKDNWSSVMNGVLDIVSRLHGMSLAGNIAVVSQEDII